MKSSVEEKKKGSSKPMEKRNSVPRVGKGKGVEGGRRIERFKKNELIQNAEKTRMMHKYKKMLRKENKTAPGAVSNSTNLSASVKNRGRTEEITNERVAAEPRERRSTRNNKSGDRETAEKAKEGGKFMSAYKKAQLEFENKQKEKQKLIDETNRKKEEKVQALAVYKKDKKKKFKSLCQRTKSGQVLIGKQMDHLLEKIKKQIKG